MSIHSLNEYSFVFDGCPKRCAIKKQEKITRQNNGKYHQILNAAIKVFAEYGYFKSTISQVAREAGVADGTIYLYFKNKDDILYNFFNYKTRLVFSGFWESVKQAGNADDMLRNLIRRHLTEFQQDRSMAIVFQREALQARYIDDAYIRDIAIMYFDILDAIIKKGQKEGTFRKDFQAGLVKRLVLGAVNEVINTWVVAGSNYDLAELADPLADLFINGIGSHAVK
jgi:TetR/AcrR family transcriptional regulator, fatty acid metabolism regulator protein